MALFELVGDQKKEPFDKVKYDNQYQKDHYDRILMLAPKGTKERFKKLADARGVSMTQFCLIIIEDWIANNIRESELQEYE